MITNRRQGKVSISGLTYNNLLEDAYNALKDSDAFKDSFTDFTSNTAERMIVELYAYMAQQLANRMDQMGNELFVDTASASGMSRLLKLASVKLDFPASASTKVKVTTSSTTASSPLFSAGINADGGNELEFLSNSFKAITASNGTNWEFISKVVDENTGSFKYDYITQHSFTPQTQYFTVHEGLTNSITYTVKSNGIDIITLPSFPVVKNSVRVYYKNKVLTPGTLNAYEIKEYTKVDNFFTTTALSTAPTNKVGTFTERNMGNGRCEISIKPFVNDDNSENDIGKELIIMYRTGSGREGNISIGAINRTERFNLTTRLAEELQTSGTGQLNIYNVESGAGGVDELTVDEIRSTVMQEVRNTKIAVTEDDYEYLFPKYDSTISLIKCYGEKNEETDELSDTYGYYSNPLYVWLILLKYNKTLNDAYLSDESTITSRINDICFNYLDINPRFNESYSVNKADINMKIEKTDLINHLDAESNTYTFDLTPNAVKVMLDGNAYITVTNHPYLESRDVTRRGVNGFRKYNGSAEKKAWSELLALTNAAVNDVYLITDIDPTGNVNNRWICKKGFDSAIDQEKYDEYWAQVDFDYIYDNLVNDEEDYEDVMYIKQTSQDSFEQVISTLAYAFSGDWNDICATGGSFTFSSSGDTTITINGIDITIPSGQRFNSAQDFCDFINSRLTPQTNILTLKGNIDETTNGISPLNINVNPGVVTSSATFILNETSYQVDLRNVITYRDLLTALNSATSINNTSLNDDGYLCDLYENENGQCWDLVMISNSSFSYSDNSTNVTSGVGFYTNYLGNGSTTFPINSELISIDQAMVSAWEDYIIINSGIITVDDDGIITINFSENDYSTMSFDGPSDSVSAMNILFGFDTSSEEHKIFKNRIIDAHLIINGTESSGTVTVRVASLDEPLNETIYINVFGGTNQRIKLGEYYENISDYISSPTLATLLERPALSHLYSTNYISNGTVYASDKYGSNYQMKFSTEVIEEQTFAQMSNDNAPAKVMMPMSRTMNMTHRDEGTYLYLKIDNIDFSDTEYVINDETYTAYNENGFAKIDLSTFNGVTAYKFIEQVVEIFSDKGEESKPLLSIAQGENETIGFETTSSSFISSIDFGKTLNSIIEELFDEETNIITSREGQIAATQIRYKALPLTSYPATTRDMEIKIITSSGTEIETVNVGYTFEEFSKNLNNMNMNNNSDRRNREQKIVLLNNGRIIFNDLVDGDSIEFKMFFSSPTQKSQWEKMFPETIVSQFEESSDHDYFKISFTNEGDYYIDTVENDSGNEYYFVVQNETTFPYGPIYFHMYEDYTQDHIISQDDNSEIVYTDEYLWNQLMTEKKVMLIEHIYKQPRFVSFDLKLKVYLPNIKYSEQNTYEKDIREHLKTKFGIYSNNIGEEITINDIILDIKNNFADVDRVVVTYLGYDMLNESTTKEQLSVKFNQKLMIASDVLTEIPVTNASGVVIGSEIVHEHGLDLSVIYSK